ncbi:hypothetical protein DESA109040_05815 [Deinococcus saxicola]|uniref:hypothetical protein n=1 Tax=Deinococcus saxicola TaxID=249406 RepID=UPI0039EF38E1
MTVKHRNQTISRRAERAQLRQGPPWNIPDAVLPLIIILAGLSVIFVPAFLADLSDTVIGATSFVPDLGTTWSGLINIGMRLLIVLGVGYVTLLVREAPWNVRAAWTAVGLGLMGNYARAVYTGSESTGSFFLLQVALLVLVYRLSTRPTVWVQLQDETERADRAEAEVERLNKAMEGRER